MIDIAPDLFHRLFLRLGVTVTLAALLFGVYFLLARKRAKRIPLSFFAVFITTFVLYLMIVILDQIELPDGSVWESASPWIKFAAYLGTAFFLIKAVDLVLLEDFLIAKKGLYIPDLLRLLFLITGVAIAALIFLRTLMGINVIALVAIPTAATAVIGFALQDTIKRFFAGITLGKLVRVGDWVMVVGREGRVTSVDLGHLTILTREDDLIMIPNNIVLQQDILNYNRPTTKHGRCVLVDATYDASPVEVQRILTEAAKSVTGVLTEPSPRAYVADFKDSSIQYKLKFWIEDYVNAPQMDGQVLTYVWYAFKREGIEIPFPQRTIRMTKTEEGAELAAKEHERSFAALRGIDFLSVLSQEELGALAQQAQIRVYLAGEVVFHQGDEGAELFFILDGHADVKVGEGTDSVVTTLNPMQFFGEMSLLTGERRSATIVAQTRLEVLVLHKEAVARPLKSNPLLVERMSTVLVQRKSGLAAHQERASRRGEGDGDREHQVQSLGLRIKKFFGLA
jgi:small-conductance mechanosensitive channel